jgi:hypothetical protein
MFEIGADTAALLYLSGTILLIVIVWLKYEKKPKKKDFLSFPSKHFVCEFCRGGYVDSPSKPFTRCPQCQFLNKNVFLKTKEKK